MAAVANGHEEALNAMIAFVKGLEPRDALEAALATQMAAVHALAMRFASQLVISKPTRGKSTRSEC
jgi:D-alanyl-D-alanine dipeptidase